MSSYRITFNKRAEKQLKKLDPDAARQIRQAIDKLADNPRPQSAKRLKGKYKGLWRERTGNYRILYEIKEQQLVIIVLRLGHRKNIY
jgi:mRNA interferase RelE/StbE